MISQPHTPTTGQVETGFALYLYDYENIVVSAGRDRFKAWLAARDARIEAAAEQRGAIKALRDAADYLAENKQVVIDGDEYTACNSCTVIQYEYLTYRADQIEGVE